MLKGKRITLRQLTPDESLRLRQGPQVHRDGQRCAHIHIDHLGALDRKLREEMQLEVKQLLRRLRLTSIFVTHDQDEALAMADRVAVMDSGRLEQLDTPEVIYEKPRTVFCAGFLGLSNTFAGSILQSNPGSLTLTTSNGLDLTCPPLELSTDQPTLMIRPEKVILMEQEVRGENCFRGEIINRKYLGATIEYHITLSSGERIVARQQQSKDGSTAYRPGGLVTVQLPMAMLRWLQP